MQQYTTEWAKRNIKSDNLVAIAQDKDLSVYGIKYEHDEDGFGTRYIEYGKMLEHPDGWENSLVTREDL